MPSLLLRLAIPTMLAQLINVLCSIVDRMFIGHMKAWAVWPLRGWGVCGPIITLLTSFSILAALRLPNLPVPLRWGRFQPRLCKRVLSLRLSPFLTYSGDGEILARSVRYIKIYTAGALFVAPQWMATDMSTALGNVHLALFCSLFRKSIFATGILLFPVLFTAPAVFAAEPFCDAAACIMSSALFLRFTPKLITKYCPQPEEQLQRTPAGGSC